MDIFPVCIAAGMIKEATHIEPGLSDLVQMIMFGSFTLEAREGNKEPVFWYDDRTNTSINAVGLKNKGLRHFLDIELPKIALPLQGTECKIGVSLAPLKSGDTGKMLEMIKMCQHKHLIDRVEINAACPNHRDGKQLHPVLAHDPVAIRQLLEELHPDDLLHTLKIAPDTSEEVLGEIVSLCSDFDISAIVSGNTRRSSSMIDGEQRLSVDQGGLAGLQLLESAVAQVKTLRRLVDLTEYRKPAIIGCGGIMSAPALSEYQKAGADEVQIATLFYQFGVDAIQDLLLQFYARD